MSYPMASGATLVHARLTRSNVGHRYRIILAPVRGLSAHGGPEHVQREILAPETEARKFGLEILFFSKLLDNITVALTRHCHVFTHSELNSNHLTSTRLLRIYYP